MAKTFTLKVPTSLTPFSRPIYRPLRLISDSFMNSLTTENAPKFGREQCEVLTSITGTFCEEIHMLFFVKFLRASVKAFVLLCYRFGGKNRNSVSARLMATAAG